MIPLLLVTIVTFLVSDSLSFVITKGFSHCIIKNQQFQKNFFEVNYQAPSNGISQTNSSSLFELDVCDYGILTSLADEHVLLGNYEMGIMMAKDAIETADRTGDKKNIYAAYAEGLLANALYGMANYQESAEHYAHALTTYENHFRDQKSPEKIEYIGASHLIAHNFLKEKNFEEAEPAWRRALFLTKELLGPKNIQVAGCMVNLAISLMKNGNLGVNPEALLIEAEKIYMEHLPETFDTQAAEHADNIVLFDGLLPTAIVNSQLGNLYVKRGDDPLAAKYYRFLEKLYRMGNVISDDLAVNALENLGVIYWRLDMFKSAEDFLQQALKIRNDKNYYTASDYDDDINVQLKLELDSLRRRERAPSRIAPEWEEKQRKKDDDEWNAKNRRH